MVEISKKITTREILERKIDLSKVKVGITDKNHLYLFWNLDYYLIEHKGQLITPPKDEVIYFLQKKELLKALDDEDIYRELIKKSKE